MKKRLVPFLVFLVLLAVFAGVFSYDPLWKKVSGFRHWKLGLDLAGGSYLVYNIDVSDIDSRDRTSVVAGLRDVIERRVNIFGVSEPRVYTESAGETSRLIVELAGIKDVNQAIQEIGATPLLDFREVEESPVAATSTDERATSTAQAGVRFIPTDLTGRYVKSAQVGFNQITGKPEVLIRFDSEGAKIFEELTGRNVGKPLAIFLDGALIEMPVVQSKISGGNAQITGSFTLDEAKKLVERFNAGALPAPITLINQQTISADFGRDALLRAIFAGALGTVFIILFMIFYYRVSGLFAAIALIMYIAFTLGVFKLIPITLTLAGIAGFLLSIGMAVDANILVFERTKEELKRGLPKKDAIEEGFKRAWTSIRDSNISTLITSGVLYYLTSSFVRGFALTLFIGVLVSMFSAITVTRTLQRVFVRDENPESLHRMTS